MFGKQKIIIILGPTASGKSDLAVHIAKKIGGEIISADSRQVYKGLDIGSGKITKGEMRGVPHYLLDITSPRSVLTAAQWNKKARKAIDDIARRGNVPIICGGTGFYIQMLTDNIILPEVKPDKKLRARLSKKSVSELFQLLKGADPQRAANIDKHNPRRLIRAIEVSHHIGSVPATGSQAKIKNFYEPCDNYEILQIGIRTGDDILRYKIDRRNESMIKRGLIAEVKKMLDARTTQKRVKELGFEYSLPLAYIKGELTKKEMLQKMNVATWRYSKRQKTWFKRDKRIKWFVISQTEKIEREVAQFLKK